ncbi:MAG: DUF3467 domain-containing protein [Bacteroidota bacterium]
MDEKNKNEAKNKLNLELSQEIAEGTYANLAMIAHSSSEFIIDFIRVMPGLPQAKVKSRVIITPEHAKRLLQALQDNLKKYEENHGTIQSPQGNTFNIPMNFGGTMGEA